MVNVQNSFEPKTHEEVKGRLEREKTIQVEYRALMKTKMRVLEELPHNKIPMGCKWVYEIKYKVDGSLDKYKARMVAKDFVQQEGVDYEDIYVPTTKIVTIKLGLSMEAYFGLDHLQMDVKRAFLNGDLVGEVYTYQHQGF